MTAPMDDLIGNVTDATIDEYVGSPAAVVVFGIANCEGCAFMDGVLADLAPRFHGRGVRRLHAAHHHTEMPGLDDDCDALWVQFPLQGLGDLHRQAFLYLQAPAEHLHKPGDLAESYYTVVGDIGDVALPVEGQEVVFAETEEVDVADHHHLVVLDRVESTVEDLFNILLIALREEPERLGNPLGSLQEPFARRVLTEKAE